MLSLKLKQLANKLCEGRLVMLLEGGYNLDALGESVADSFFGLLGEPSIDTLNRSGIETEPMSEVESLLKRVSQLM